MEIETSVETELGSGDAISTTTIQPSEELSGLIQETAATIVASENSAKKLMKKVLEKGLAEGLTREQVGSLLREALLQKRLSDRHVRRLLPPWAKREYHFQSKPQEGAPEDESQGSSDNSPTQQPPTKPAPTTLRVNKDLYLELIRFFGSADKSKREFVELKAEEREDGVMYILPPLF